MILDSDSRRPEIDYPCNWGYKVIGNDVDEMLEAIEDASSGLDYSVTPSNISKNGNYFSLNFRMEIPNEVVRNIVYDKLDKSKAVLMVL